MTANRLRPKASQSHSRVGITVIVSSESGWTVCSGFASGFHSHRSIKAAHREASPRRRGERGFGPRRTAWDIAPGPAMAGAAVGESVHRVQSFGWSLRGQNSSSAEVVAVITVVPMLDVETVVEIDGAVERELDVGIEV